MPPLTRLTVHVAALATFAALAAPAAQAATLPLQHASTTVADVPHDGVVGPGDVLTIRETVTNGGGSTITGLQGTLTSSTPGVTVDAGRLGLSGHRRRRNTAEQHPVHGLSVARAALRHGGQPQPRPDERG